jgi:hypothetical protein
MSTPDNQITVKLTDQQADFLTKRLRTKAKADSSVKKADVLREIFSAGIRTLRDEES